jgi:hypothetical protein
VAGGWTVDGYDLASAERVFTFCAEDQQGGGGGGAYGGNDGGDGGLFTPSAVPPVTERPFTAVAMAGSLVAAGRAGCVALWDVRESSGGGRPVGVLRAPPPPAAAAAVGAPAPACVGVQLDEWKLVTGFAGAGFAGPGVEHSLAVFDIRAAGGSGSGGGGGGGGGHGGASGRWAREPLLVLGAPSRITCFSFHGERLLVGQQGGENLLWSFLAPGTLARLQQHAAAAEWGDGAGGGGGGGGGARRKAGGASSAVGRRQTRYPKRSTR